MQWEQSAYPDATSCHVRDIHRIVAGSGAAGGDERTIGREWRCCCAAGFTGADADVDAANNCSDPAGYPSDGCVPATPAAECRNALATALDTLNLTDKAGGRLIPALSEVEPRCDLLPTTGPDGWESYISPHGVQCTAVVTRTGAAILGGWSCMAGDAVRDRYILCFFLQRMRYSCFAVRECYRVSRSLACIQPQCDSISSLGRSIL